MLESNTSIQFINNFDENAKTGKGSHTHTHTRTHTHTGAHVERERERESNWYFNILSERVRAKQQFLNGLP